MTVVDTSALAAILFAEADADRFARAIELAPVRYLSAANRVEMTLVIESRKRESGRADLERLLAEAAIETVPVTTEQAKLACEAFRRFGKGRHPAALNFGDVFAYALAKSLGEPLLFKGEDFARTDVEPALMQED